MQDLGDCNYVMLFTPDDVADNIVDTKAG